MEIEREFLQVLEGGCTAPIGALATIKEETVEFNGALFSLDGKIKLEEKASFSLKNYKNQGEKAAKSILSNGGKELMRDIKAKLNN